jgi:hypothetical protein
MYGTKEPEDADISFAWLTSFISVCNLITDADEACRSSEISFDLIIIIVFLLYFSMFF